MTVWDALPRASEAIRSQVSERGAPHALLLLGASPSLKRASALAFAAAVNCLDAPGVGCGQCSSCARTTRNRHPDVHYIAPEGAVIGVDVIRDAVLAEAARSPFEAASKVFVIEEAERMHPSAQNALLKTLEEPHEDTFFVLTCEREVELLDTIFSRCRVIRLTGATEDEITERLRAEGADARRAVELARIAEGDLDRARALLDDKEVAERRVSWLSLPERLTSPGAALECAVEVIDVVASAVKSKEAEQKEEISQLAEAMGERRGTAQARNALVRRHRRELRRLEEELLGEAFSTLASFYRDVVVVRRGAEHAAINADRHDVLAEWSSRSASDEVLVAATARCVETRAALATNANTSLAVEAGLVGVARLVGPLALSSR